MPLDIRLRRLWLHSGFSSVRKVSHGGHSKAQLRWMCGVSEVIPSQYYDGLYRHVCGLPKNHYGRHQCWCECVFGGVDANYRPPKLIEIPWDKWDAS